MGSVLQLLAPALFFQVVVIVSGAFGMALGSSTIRVVAERLVGTTMQLVALAAVLFLGMGVAGVMLAYVGGMLSAAVVAVYLVWRIYPRMGHVPPLWANIKKLYLYSYKQGLARMVGYLLSNLNLLVLGYLASASEVGIYAAASRLTLVGLLFLEAFAQMYGTIAANKQREATFREDVQRVTKWTVIFSTPLFVLLAVFAPTWMAVMGPEFVVGAPVLALLAVSQLISMFTGSTGFLLAVRGHPGLALVNAVCGWGTSALLTIVLADTFGAFGAALAYFAAILVFVVLELSESRVVFGFFQLGRSILPPTLILGIFGVIAIWLRLSGTWNLIQTVILCVFLLCGYALAIWRFALQPVDIVAFKGLVSGLRPIRSLPES
jgi:O-antigen/teichoic acid export membrane protein